MLKPILYLIGKTEKSDPKLIDYIGNGTLEDTALSTLDTFLDQIRNMFPENIVQATFQQVHTEYKEVRPKIQKIGSGGNATNFTAASYMKPTLEHENEMNVLGLIVFCTGFGVILSILGEQARLMINFFIVLDAVIMKWISALM
uniref:Amino acid transporter n=1 Tax=Acrobeloides nanus TaxID=290746 RepID=A0A914D7S4_9BILA